ncbi:MAG: HU family DNA-binding protein [Verrucomicrobia bacterium]|jgi:DNA-binding protein HU-beta|nr:HU family DNA-binding protein [Verrucomicrobiota bacterium]
MNKADLVNSVSEKTGLTKTKSNQVIDVVIETISESLKSGEKVTLVGFGTFTTSQREARRGRNPKTGQTLEIPAKKVPKFKPGTELSKNVN